ncbi:MAG: transporter substrate-binding domain-containing protein [Rhodospirillales bacterium]|nr:transporter substrate-binding domain-containing protein [Rhodospirillales bacterium]
MNHQINKDTGQWEGWVIEATKQLVADLKPIGVKDWKCEATDWSTVAVALQAGKMDAMFNLQATPLRSTVISFAGPLFQHAVVVISGKNVPIGKTWEDYNKKNVRVAVVTGSSTDIIRKVVMPNAQPIMLGRQDDTLLSVAAGRSDILIDWMMPGTAMKLKNPDVGSLVIPTPAYTFPQYVGIARDEDGVFRDFMQYWVEWQRLQGNTQQWIKDRLIHLGMDPKDIPDQIVF